MDSLCCSIFELVDLTGSVLTELCLELSALALVVSDEALPERLAAKLARPLRGLAADATVSLDDEGWKE